MRKEYDARFRATGEAGTVQTRRNADGTQPVPEEEKEGLWQRMKFF
jgi:hypothetical protein